MKHNKILETFCLILSIGTLVLICQYVFQDHSISEAALKKDFRIYQKRPFPKAFSNEIRRFGRTEADAARLSQKIIAISQCLQISPYVFTALIAQESSFNSDAVSPTFARGLTQFTTIAIKDVEIALRHSKSSDHFLPIIHGCIRPRIGLTTWEPPYERHRSLIKQKKILHDEDYALIYGAVFLKMLLARSYEKNPGLSLSSHYRNALTAYNGDLNLRFDGKSFRPEKYIFRDRVLRQAQYYAKNI